jgi:hypothetical protein
VRVVDDGGVDLVTLIADESGNAHLAFVPRQHTVLDRPDAIVDALATGDTLQPGAYRTFDDSSTPPTDLGTVQVLSVEDHPDPSLYDQELAEGYGYLTVRDGVQLSVMVRFPSPDLYGPPPYPTVIEYSGYSPSDPDEPQPSTLLANLMGFAVVGVNMRGSGCSGGVFDVFSPAQAADGYDVVETVARQPWVLHGRPGMVGLSYPGISQLRRIWQQLRRCRSSTTCGASSGPAASTTRASPGRGWRCATNRPLPAARPGTCGGSRRVTGSPRRTSGCARRTSTSSSSVAASRTSGRCSRPAGPRR